MKLKNLHLLACLALAFFFSVSFISGCKKSNDGSSSAGLSASISGASFQSINTVAVDDKTYFDDITITGSAVMAGDTASFYIRFPDSVKVNEVLTITNYSDIEIDYYSKKGTNTQYTGDDISGTNVTITITAIDTTAHKVAGTFSGTLPLVNGNSSVNSIAITNGRFNTSYTVD